MKKYRLKKDLPTWKAGEEFWIGEDECLYGASEEGEPIMVYHAITLVNFDLLKNGEWLEEIEEKPKSIWDLKEIDDYFYYIGKYGEIRETNMGTEEMSEYGNIFLTLEEAEKELKRREAIQKIKKYFWENNIETDYKINNNLGFILSPLGIVTFQSVRRNGNPIGYFSEENTEKILEKFEDELKIILDV